MAYGCFLLMVTDITVSRWSNFLGNSIVRAFDVDVRNCPELFGFPWLSLGDDEWCSG
jgi:hypothetical protein